jgi:hypothetical protein
LDGLAAAGNAIGTGRTACLAGQPARRDTWRALGERIAARWHCGLAKAKLARVAGVHAPRHGLARLALAWIEPSVEGARPEPVVVRGPEPDVVVASRGQLAAPEAITSVRREQVAHGVAGGRLHRLELRAGGCCSRGLGILVVSARRTEGRLRIIIRGHFVRIAPVVPVTIVVACACSIVEITVRDARLARTGNGGYEHLFRVVTGSPALGVVRVGKAVAVPEGTPPRHRSRPARCCSTTPRPQPRLARPLLRAARCCCSTQARPHFRPGRRRSTTHPSHPSPRRPHRLARSPVPSTRQARSGCTRRQRRKMPSCVEHAPSWTPRPVRQETPTWAFAGLFTSTSTTSINASASLREHRVDTVECPVFVGTGGVGHARAVGRTVRAGLRDETPPVTHKGASQTVDPEAPEVRV